MTILSPLICLQYQGSYVTTPLQNRAIQRIATKDRFDTTAGNRGIWHENVAVDSTASFMWSRLSCTFFCRQSPHQQEEQKNRQPFAIEYVVWTDENLAGVFFNNENKFNLAGIEDKQYVRWYKGESLLPKCVNNQLNLEVWWYIAMGDFLLCLCWPTISITW